MKVVDLVNVAAPDARVAADEASEGEGERCPSPLTRPQDSCGRWCLRGRGRWTRCVASVIREENVPVYEAATGQEEPKGELSKACRHRQAHGWLRRSWRAEGQGEHCND